MIAFRPSNIFLKIALRFQYVFHRRFSSVRYSESFVAQLRILNFCHFVFKLHMFKNFAGFEQCNLSSGNVHIATYKCSLMSQRFVGSSWKTFLRMSRSSSIFSVSSTLRLSKGNSYILARKLSEKRK